MNKYKLLKPFFIIFVLIALTGCNDATERNNKAENNVILESAPEETTPPSNEPELTAVPTLKSDKDVELPRVLNTSKLSEPECWLLYESDYEIGDLNPKIYEIYVNVDKSSNTWKEEVKKVLTHLIAEYNEYEEVMFKMFDSKEGKAYQVIAVWESRNNDSSLLIWYPDGSGANAKTETENWLPK